MDLCKEMVAFPGDTRGLNSLNSLFAWPSLKEVLEYVIPEDGYKLNLHNYYRNEAIQLFKVHIAAIYLRRSWNTIILIPGKGNHSPGNIPVIKNSLLAFLGAWGLDHSVVQGNEGRVRVRFRRR